MLTDSSILSEFTDVTPVDVRDPENGFCKIVLSPDFVEYVGILCACIKNGEISDRVYRLTEQVIMMNSQFITAWIIRQQCIKQLGVDWEYEFEFLDKIRGINEKCYQTWMHRRFCVELSGNYSLEKEYCDSYIKMDNKNIHSWSHRLWVVQTYNLWDGELKYTDHYLDIDIFNNSAWSYRFSVFTHFHEASQQIPDEIEYTIEKLNKAPHNEACWNYITGLMKHYENQDFSDIAYEAKRLLNKDESIIYAYSFLIDYNKSTFEIEKIDEALKYCERLEELDDTRSLYWKKVADDIHSEYQFLYDTM